MLQPATLTFLQDIAQNNNKPWLDAHRDIYLAAKEDYEQAVGAILSGMAAADPIYKELKAKDCVMRIFRDVRFSKDKVPYKVNFGAGFSSGGRKFPGAGYYLHIEPGGKSFAGGGMWQPDGPMLKAVRQEIDYSYKEFEGIIDDKQFKALFGQIDGERLKKMPQGYTEDNKAATYLKLKSFTVGCVLTDEEVTGTQFEKRVVEIFAAMRPFITFLNRSVA